MSQIFAFLLLGGGIGAGTYLTSQGMNAAGVTAIIGAIATPIIAILRGKRDE